MITFSKHVAICKEGSRHIWLGCGEKDVSYLEKKFKGKVITVEKVEVSHSEYNNGFDKIVKKRHKVYFEGFDGMAAESAYLAETQQLIWYDGLTDEEKFLYQMAGLEALLEEMS